MRNAVLAFNISTGRVQWGRVVFSGGSPRLVSFGEAKAENGVIPPEFAKELRQKPSGISAVCVSVPSDEAIITVIRLPFADRDRIEETIRFEAAKYLPFPMEEAVSDYSVIERGRDHSAVLFAAMRRETLQKYVSAFEREGKVPDLAAPDIICLARLLECEDKTCILADVERGASRLSVVRGGAPVFNQALSSGWDDPGGLASGLRLFKGVFGLREPSAEPDEVFLAGESVPGDLPGFLSRELGMRANMLNPPELSAGPEIPLDDEKCRRGAAILLGLARLWFSREKRPNLKEKPPEKSFFSRALLTAGLGVLLFFFLAGSVFVRYERRKAYLDSLRQRSSDRIESIVENDYLAGRPDAEIISILRSRIEEAEEEASALREVGSGSVLEVLREISLRVGESARMELTEIRIDRGTAYLDGRADSFRQLEDIFAALSDSEYFETVKRSRAQADSTRGGVVFRIEMSYPDDFFSPAAGGDGDE